MTLIPKNITIGIDEAGRGPLAGPVMAAAVWLDAQRIPTDLLARIDDSKKLSAKNRTDIAAQLWRLCREPNPPIRAALGAATVAEIDRLNILQATFLAMIRAVTRLRVMPITPENEADLNSAYFYADHVTLLIDGTQIPPVWRQADCPFYAQAIIGGDGLCKEIAAASILAKTARDLAMQKLDRIYPEFGFARHAGYGTTFHRAAIAEFGLTPHHRPLFCRGSLFLERV
ncbi:MAG: ribonuclease HII [Alphaproteobacteria bacterium]|nr:ribonuclease HII [Alphaproteobacteria bacterium]